MSKIPFTKMHGAGNDYIYVNAMLHPVENPSEAAVRWSDRHKGIGADGLVLIDRSAIPEADFSMRIFNADGSEAMMCGNACRCIGKYLYEKGLTQATQIRLLTLSGVKTLSLDVADGRVERVTVDMGEPVFEDEALFLPDNARQLAGETLLALEHHPAFPQRCNIEFARVDADGTIRTRVWERGSGITQACGTGACATAVAAAVTGRAGRQSQIVMDGGTLSVAWCETDRHVYLTGPAAFVFDGEIVP